MTTQDFEHIRLCQRGNQESNPKSLITEYKSVIIVISGGGSRILCRRMVPTLFLHKKVPKPPHCGEKTTDAPVGSVNEKLELHKVLT